MSPWPAPERPAWKPRCGVLRPIEVQRFLTEHRDWRLDEDGLVRELHFKDFTAALAFVNRVADEAVHFGRHPDVHIVDENIVKLHVSNPHHVGITLAELRLVEDVDAAVERSEQPAFSAA